MPTYIDGSYLAAIDPSENGMFANAVSLTDVFNRESAVIHRNCPQW